MGNSQKGKEELKVEIAPNLGQFLTDIQVQDTQNELPINVPIPPTPCFKEDNKIQVIPQQILTKMYEQEDKLKEQREFEIQLQKEEKQIQKAKASYQRRKNQNILLFRQIQDRKATCLQIYEDTHDSIDGDENKNNNLSQQESQTEVIWGKKVSTKKDNPMEEYLKYRFPKEENSGQSEQYRNWNIYKQKMYRDEMEQLDSKQEKLRNLEADLKEKYITLLEKKQQRLNSSITYAAIKQKQARSKKFVSTPSPKKKKKYQKDSESQNSSPTSPKKISKKRSQQAIDFNMSQSFQKQTQDTTTESPSFVSDFLSGMQDKNPQHMSPKQPQVDFFAKQIFYYQNYTSKRRSSFVYSREEAQRVTMEENQYPSRRKNYERPSRCVENVERSRSFKSKSKSPKKKKVVVQELTNQEKKLEDLETSVYHKVYEKIPKQKTKMMYSELQGKLKEVDDFYPYEGSPSQNKQKDEFPATIKVNDSIGNSPLEEVTEYRIDSRQKSHPDQLGYQNFERQSRLEIGQVVQEMTEQQKEVWRKKRSQRDYEAKILDRVRRKHLA